MKKLTDTLQIGNPVAWRHAWGSGPLKEAVISHIMITAEPRSKDGEDAEEAPWTLVLENRVLVNLTNGSWAYGSQISPPGTDPRDWHKGTTRDAQRLGWLEFTRLLGLLELSQESTPPTTGEEQ